MKKWKWIIQFTVGFVLLAASLELWGMTLLGIKGFVGFWCFMIGSFLVFLAGINFHKQCAIRE